MKLYQMINLNGILLLEMFAEQHIDLFGQLE